MNIKKTLLVTLSGAVALSLLGISAFANQNNRSEVAEEKIPEVAGVYDQPGHPGVKVRVFVHKEKPENPGNSGNKPDRGSDNDNSEPVCSADPDSQEKVAHAGWYLPGIVSYSLNTGSVPSSVGAANFEAIAGRAYSDWAQASGDAVSFTQLTDTNVDRSSYDGLNILAFGRTSGQALGVTYVRYYTSTGEVVDVDTILNKKFKWQWADSATCADPDSYDAGAIIEHEIGHWLGLDDEYDEAIHGDATMYGYAGKGEVKKNTLEDGDITGAYDIYNN